MKERSFRFSGQGLSCFRGGRVIFSKKKFSLKSHDALILTGPNGIGKTSFLEILAGAHRPEAGNIFLYGKPSSISELHHHTAYIGHKVFFKPILTLDENISFWRSLYGTDIENKEILEKVGLPKLGKKRFGDLSHGQKRRALFSQLFLKPQAKTWLLDEPAQGLDGEGRSMLTALVRAHLEKGGCAVIATHLALYISKAHLMDMTQ